MNSEIKENAHGHDYDKSREDAWKSEISIEHINADTPQELWDTIASMALDKITDVSETKDEVIGRAALWNRGNDPHLPVEFLILQILRALRHWKPKPK